MKKLLLRSCGLFFVLLFQNVGAQPCSGPPPSNTAVVSATSVCLGNNLSFSLAGTSAVTGYTYQWGFSTVTQFGPFTAINGATATSLSTNTLTVSGWYSVVITCTNSNQISTATAVFVQINAPGTTSTVPYYEGMQGIMNNNDLPNCSWAASNLGSNCVSFTNAPSFTGNKAIAFAYTGAGQYSFFSNGLQLQAGILYSVSAWYSVATPNTNNWQSLTLHVAGSQALSGSQVVAGTPNPGLAVAYNSVSGTFSVTSNGVYYIGMRGTAAVSTASAPYLYIDDLMVTIPCTGAGTVNLPPVSIVASSPSVCSCNGLTLTASGAGTYTWNTGSTGPVYSSTCISAPSTFVVTGTNTLSGCVNTASTSINVFMSPNIFLLSQSSTVVCSGQTAHYSLAGAPSYTVTSPAGSFTLAGPPTQFTVSPLSTTIYTIVGSNTVGCKSTPIYLNVTVAPDPTPTIVNTNTLICKGDEITLQATGALTYTWFAGIQQTVALIVSASPAQTTTFFLTGTSIAGCNGMTKQVVTVEECLGLISRGIDRTGLMVYPSPVINSVWIRSAGVIRSVQIFNSAGSLVMQKDLNEKEINFNLVSLSPGLYFMSVLQNGERQQIRFLKE